MELLRWNYSDVSTAQDVLNAVKSLRVDKIVLTQHNTWLLLLLFECGMMYIP